MELSESVKKMSSPQKGNKGRQIVGNKNRSLVPRSRPKTTQTKHNKNINVFVMPEYDVCNVDQETIKPNLQQHSNDILSPEDLQLQNETIKMINRSLGQDQLSHILNLNLHNRSDNDNSDLKLIEI